MSLRGAIEQVRGDVVSGWVYASETPVRDRLVLAFEGDACLGAGRVSIHRPDIEAAGLGDGWSGFHFRIQPVDPAAEPRVVVRLEGDDAVLAQRALLLGQAPTPAPPPLASPPPSAVAGTGLASPQTLRWMRGRGWLDAADYAGLRALLRTGVGEVTLARPDGPPQGPSERAAELLSLLTLREVTLEPMLATEPEAFDGLVAEVREGAEAPLVAVWSNSPTSLSVVEGSHLAAPEARLAPEFGVAYELRPERLLLLDARCALAGRGANGDQVLLFRIKPNA
jgi:hypothetical protein